MAIDAIIQNDTTERCDLWEEFTFIATQLIPRPKDDYESSRRINLSCIYIIVGQDYALTFRSPEVSDTIVNVQDRLTKVIMKSFGPTWAMYAILDKIVG